MNKKKEIEHFYLNHFFSFLLGSKNPNVQIQCGESPDFIVTMQQKKVGIGVTNFYSDEKGVNNLPRQAIEQEWEKLQKKIMEEIQKYNNLKKTHGHLFFKDLGIPPRKIQGKFIEELIKLSLKMIDSDCIEVNFYCKEIMTGNDYSYPLLKDYLNEFHLEKIDCNYCTWGWNHDVSSIGLTEEELINTIESKIEKAATYKQKDIDELWLLISSGHQLSQAMGIRLLDKLNNYDHLNNILGQSEFEKVYIYQHMHSVIYEWPGWNKFGKENFLNSDI